MSVALAALLADPIFQLNVVLWMVQRLPDEAPAFPILRRAGYHLHAIGPPFPPRAAIRQALHGLVGGTAAARPDVVLECREDPALLVVECKAQSFGPDGVTTRQALKLLAVATDLAEPLNLPTGQPRPGHVSYLTGLDGQAAMLSTLAELQARLAGASIPAASAGSLGLEARGDGVWVDAASVDPWPPPAAEALARPVCVLRVLPGDEGPRPLYLIPWDPGVESGQDPELAAFGKAVLTARVLNAAKSVIGRAAVPGPVVLNTRDLLREASSGVSDFWRDRNDFQQLLGGCQKIVSEALRPVARDVSMVVPHQHDFVQLTLTSDSLQDAAISALQGAEPTALQEHLGQLALFEDP